MARDTVDYEAELSLLLDEMEGDQGDLREVHMRLITMLSTMRAEGLPVPEDLERLEAELDQLFSGQARQPGVPPGKTPELKAPADTVETVRRRLKAGRWLTGSRTHD